VGEQRQSQARESLLLLIGPNGRVDNRLPLPSGTDAIFAPAFCTPDAAGGDR